MFRAALLASAVLLTAPPAAHAQKDLTITFGEDSTADRTYDPRVTQSRHETQVIVQIFDQLVASDENNKLYPGLAKSWAVAPDGLSVTFQLREGVTFHDGTPFNAEAVAFNFDSIQDPKLGSQGAIDELGPYAGSEIIGPYEIKVKYKRPYGAAVGMLSQTDLSIVSPTAAKKLGNDGFAEHPVGTGPFKFVSWERGQKVVMERNDAYNWAPEFMEHQGPSAVARVVSRFIGDASTRVAALEAGEIDMSDFTPILDMKRFADDPKFKVLIGSATGLPFGLTLNSSHPIFDDIRVRKAFALGLDRPALADNLFFGMIKPAFGPISTTTPTYWPGVEKYYQYDPKAAMALLDEAGWKPGPDGIRVKNGQRLEANYHALSVIEPDTGVEVQAQLRKVGFDIKVEIITLAKRDDLAMNNQDSIQTLRWLSGDPSCLEVMFHSRNIPSPGHAKFNWPHLSNPDLDSLLEKAAGVSDPQQRNDLYAQAQKMIMDSAVWVPLHDQVNTIAYRANRTGYRWARTQWNVRMYEVTEAK